jgi:6-methylsalicylate decarboxylase
MLRYIGTDRQLYGSDCAVKADGAVIKLAEVMTAEMGRIWKQEEWRAVSVGNAQCRDISEGKKFLSGSNNT